MIHVFIAKQQPIYIDHELSKTGNKEATKWVRENCGVFKLISKNYIPYEGHHHGINDPGHAHGQPFNGYVPDVTKAEEYGSASVILTDDSDAVMFKLMFGDHFDQE